MTPRSKIERLLRPRSVAVIGASADPTKTAGRPVATSTSSRSAPSISAQTASYSAPGATLPAGSRPARLIRTAPLASLGRQNARLPAQPASR